MFNFAAFSEALHKLKFVFVNWTSVAVDFALSTQTVLLWEHRDWLIEHACWLAFDCTFANSDATWLALLWLLANSDATCTEKYLLRFKQLKNWHEIHQNSRCFFFFCLLTCWIRSKWIPAQNPWGQNPAQKKPKKRNKALVFWKQAVFEYKLFYRCSEPSIVFKKIKN